MVLFCVVAEGHGGGLGSGMQRTALEVGAAPHPHPAPWFYLEHPNHFSELAVASLGSQTPGWPSDAATLPPTWGAILPQDPSQRWPKEVAQERAPGSVGSE